MEILSQVFSKSNIAFMFQGIGMMLSVAVVAILLSLLFGTILGAAKSYGPKPLRVIVSVYIEIFRTTPNLLWILIIYFLVPFGKEIPSMVKDFMSGSLAFTLFTSAVVAEIVRGGLNSVPKGQFEAAASQGFSLPDFEDDRSSTGFACQHSGASQPGDHGRKRYFSVGGCQYCRIHCKRQNCHCTIFG